MSTTARLEGVPDDQLFAHDLSVLTADGFPTTPSNVTGRYFSVQSLIAETSRHYDPEQVRSLVYVQRHAQQNDQDAVAAGAHAHVPVQGRHGQEHRASDPFLHHQVAQAVHREEPRYKSQHHGRYASFGKGERRLGLERIPASPAEELAWKGLVAAARADALRRAVADGVRLRFETTAYVAEIGILVYLGSALRTDVSHLAPPTTFIVYESASR
jgi:hypothetical protein